MTKTFVAVDEPVHHLIRKVTRHVPLVLQVSRGGQPILAYQVKPEELPDEYYSLAMLHAVGGMTLSCLQKTRWQPRPADRLSIAEQVSYFDAVRLDRRCCRDIRLKQRKRGPAMVSGELLAFGSGTLRARNDDQDDTLQRYLWTQHGRLNSRHEVVYARIRTLHRNCSPDMLLPGKESFDSSNMIYGDAFGEVEQIWERRADTDFLNQVCLALRGLRPTGEIAAYHHPPQNLEDLVQIHLQRQALWKSPPTHARVLLRRIDYILSHTVLDAGCETCFSSKAPRVQVHTQKNRNGSPTWSLDRSGYEGWLI
jgi:hypothetical protein